MTDDATPPAAPRGVTAEHARLAEATGAAEDVLSEANPWYEWGPYLSERAWGTVREDYSDSGDAWEYFPHDHARSRAFRWNEDGMAGLSDIHHDLCLGLALWNGADPILKERMFESTVAGPARSPVADDRPTRDMSFERAGDDLIDGLFVGLDAWQWLLLRLDRSPERGRQRLTGPPGGRRSAVRRGRRRSRTLALQRSPSGGHRAHLERSSKWQETPSQAGRSRSSRRVLVPLALAQFICSFAGSNMNVMINDISEDLDTTVQGVQTAITIFLLVMAALMIPGGKLTDRWGRKRCFIVGLALTGSAR